jgi:hypothetical protein
MKTNHTPGPELRRITWTVDHPEADYSTRSGVDQDGNRYRMTANLEIVSCWLTDGRVGESWTGEGAYYDAMRQEDTK